MSVHRTIRPRAWTTAAGAAFIAGLPGTRPSDTIALRPDPANPDLLVVDFGAGASSATVDSATSAAISADDLVSGGTGGIGHDTAFLGTGQP